MAVYVLVSPQQVREFLEIYPVGELIRYEGIAEGQSNSNYFVETTAGRFVLTITDNISREDTQYIFSLTQFLGGKGIPCIQTVKTMTGQCCHFINGQLAVLTYFLPGKSLLNPSLAQCRSVGRLLAQQHLAAKAFSQCRENPHGFDWLNKTVLKLSPLVSEEERQCLSAVLKQVNSYDWAALPKGTIHADCFRDNVLFVDEQISGVLDYYFACDDYLLLDLATAVIDWCQTSNGYLNTQKSDQLLGGYQQLRVLTSGEKASWPASVALAALRFWLGRLLKKYFPRQSLTQNKANNKTPEEMQQLIEASLNSAFVQKLPDATS